MKPHQLQKTSKKSYSLINQNVGTNIVHMNQRRYDIDALRSIAMFLLIFYHLAISFTSVAPYIAFVQNKRFNDGVWDLLSVMNSWRIPLVFLISGIALRLSLQRRTKIEMLKERIKILIVPYIFGTVIFGTASLAIAFTFYEGWSNEYLWLGVITIFDGVHLWFLKNIFIYCLILIPLLNLISNKADKETIFSKILNMPGGVFVFSIPVILEGHLLNATAYSEIVNYGRSYQEYANTIHGFLLGFIWFFLGVLLVSQGEVFWESNKRNWKTHLLLGFAFYFYRFINNFEDGFSLDNRLIAFESFNFIFLMLGLGAVYLNKDSPQLTYYKTAVYPVYIVHLPVQMAVMYFFAGINIHPLIKFPIALFLICFLSLTIYHAIKNIKPLRPLFGLRNQ